MRGSNLAIIIENSLSSTPVKMSIHQIFQRGITYFNLKRDQLKSGDHHLSLHGKSVEKIQLICYEQSNPRQPVICHAFIRYKNQETNIFTVRQTRIKILLHFFVLHGATPEDVFRRTSVKNMNWLNTTQRFIYEKYHAGSSDSDSPAIYYADLHHDLTNSVVSLVNQHAGAPINIIDGGCGDGTLIKNIAEEVLARCNDGTNPSYIGFDFNKNNLADCEANYTGPCRFVLGNLLETDKVINTLQADHLIHTEANAVSILLLSGSLTRLVLRDLYAGIEALSTIARSMNIKFLLGGGVGEPMINKYLAKQHGFKQNILSKTKSELFFYSRMSAEEFAAYKIDKMRRKNILDLSFCPFDHAIDDLLAHVTDNMVIDLSYCHYTAYLEEAIWHLVQQRPNVRLIFQHDNPETLHAFQQRFLGKALITALLLSENKNEFDLFGVMRRAPRQHSTFFRASIADNTLKEMQLTKQTRAFRLSDYLAAYQGARYFADVNIYEAFIALHFTQCHITQDYFATRTLGITQLLNSVKQRLLDQHSDKLLELLGSDYKSKIESLCFNQSQSMAFREMSLCLNLLPPESYEFMTSACRQLICDEIAKLEVRALQEHNLEALMTLLSIRIKAIVIYHSNWVRIFPINLADSKPENLQQELLLYRYLNDHYPNADDPDFLKQLALHSAANYHNYSLVNPQMVIDPDPALLGIFDNLWVIDSGSPKTRRDTNNSSL